MSLRGDIDIVTALKVVTDAGEAAREYDKFVQEVVSGSSDADDAIKDVGDESKKTREKGKTSFLGLSLSAASFAATMASVGGIAMGAFSSMLSASPALTGELILMRAEFRELFRVLGNDIAPIFDALNVLLSDMVDWFKAQPEWIQEFVSHLVFATIAVAALTLAVITLSAVSAPLILTIGGIAFAIAALVTMIKTNFLGVADNYHDAIQKIKDQTGFWSDDTVQSTKAVVIVFKILAEVFKRVFTATLRLGLMVVADAFIFVLNVITDVINAIIEILTGLYNFVIGVFTGDWRRAWDGIGDVVNAVVELIANIIAEIIRLIGNLVEDVGDAWETLFGESVFSNAIQNVGTWLQGFADTIIEFFDDLVSKGFEWGADMIQAFIDGIASMLSELGDLLAEVGDDIADFIGFSLPKRGPLRKTTEWGKHMAEQFLIKGFGSEAKSIIGVGGPNSPIAPIASVLPMAMAGGSSNITNSRSNQSSASVNMPITIKIASFSGNRRDLDRLAAEVTRRIQNRVLMRVKGT